MALKRNAGEYLNSAFGVPQRLLDHKRATAPFGSGGKFNPVRPRRKVHHQRQAVRAGSKLAKLVLDHLLAHIVKHPQLHFRCRRER